jgi:hypothetical protein
MFRLDRFALARTQVATKLTATPTMATTRMAPPSTGDGFTSRLMASNAMIPDTTSRVIPLAAADKISARFQP